MLSNIGRAAVRSAGIGGSHSTCRVGQWTWQLQRVCVSQNSSYAPQSNTTNNGQLRYSLKRSYVTATNSAAKPRATRTTASKTTKKPVKKAAKKVAKPKVKAKPKKKSIAKKAKPAIKVLTEGQLAKRAELKAKAEIKELKAKALLNQPRTVPSSAWLVVIAEAMKDPVGYKANGVRGQAAVAAAKYKSLTPSERESYNHIANQNKAANEIAYKKWVESHTPYEIKVANQARGTLKRKKIAVRIPVPETIRDARQPSRGVGTARAGFFTARFASGDMKGIPFIEAAQAISKEWEELPASDKKPFEDQAASDRRRYQQEYKTVYHRDPPAKKASATV